MKEFIDPPTISFQEHLRLPKAMLDHYPEAYLKYFAKYGDVFQIKFPYKAHLYFHPDHVRHILKDNTQNYKKSWMYQSLKPILGKGLVSSEGDLWREQRKRVAPEFQSKSIERFAESMMERTNQFADIWKKCGRENPGAARDVSEDMMKLTLQIVGDTLFGSDFENESEEMAQNLYILLNHTLKKIVSVVPMPEWVPTNGNREALRAQERVDQIVLAIIRKKSRAMEAFSSRGTDVLTRLIMGKMDETLLIDEVKTLIFAGHETTSLVLSWAWYLLAQNPDKEKKLFWELKNVLQGRLPTYEDLPNLPYTKMVILESMRLYPPVPAFSRTAINDDQIGKYKVKAGTTVQVVPYVTHRHPKFWKEPLAFVPERFLEEIFPMAFFPFSAGARSCIGENFAMVESELILATLASQFRLNLASEVKVESEAINTLRPKGGLKMNIELRS